MSAPTTIDLAARFAHMRELPDLFDTVDGPAPRPTDAAIARGLFLVLECERLGMVVEDFDVDVLGGVGLDVSVGDRSAWLSVMNHGFEGCVRSQGGRLVESTSGIDLPRIKAWLDGGTYE